MLPSIKRKIRHYWKKLKGVSWKLDYILSSLLINKKKMDGFLRQKKIFFVLGTGRSGTNTLSHLLNKNSNSLVLHEPDFFSDIAVMEGCNKDPILSKNYMSYRKIKIYRRLKMNPVEIYGEVTGTIRYQIKEIKEEFPNAKILLVTRDGRDVVRSVMRWNFYTPGSKGAYNIQPLPDDTIYPRWKQMSRFEKISWSWSDSNRKLIAFIEPQHIIKLEDILRNYEKFKSSILDPLELNVSYEDWMTATSNPAKNAADQHTFPHWKDWTSQQQNEFDDLCSETMCQLGYYEEKKQISKT